MRKFIVPLISTVVLSILLSWVFMRVDLTPMLASSEGAAIDTLLRALFIVTAIVFSLVISFLLYSLINFRRRPGDTQDAAPVHGHLGLEIAWTVIPLITVVALASWATVILLEIKGQSSADELLVDVTGVQWAWSFDYPEYGVNSSELVLPVDRPALLHIRSTDVIHSFWVPEFRIKMDAVPGILNEARVTPTELGDYTAYCSELCGTAHAYMTAPVRVISQDEFEVWISQQQAAQAEGGPGGTGAQYAQQFGCLGCHSTDGSVLVGPSFQGLYGSERTFEDGTTAIADEDYLRQSILDPGSQVVEGFTSIMQQGYADQISTAELDGIIQFIQSLEN